MPFLASQPTTPYHPFVAAPAGRRFSSEAASERAVEEELLRRYHDDGDLEARARAILRLIPIARRLAGTFRQAMVPADELTHIALLALINAVDRFEPDDGTSIIDCAVRAISRELERYCSAIAAA